MSPPKILYTSFDQVPAPKGASTHILAFAQAIGNRYQNVETRDSKVTSSAEKPQETRGDGGNVVLVTPSQQDVPLRQILPGVRHLQLGCAEDNPLGRAKVFREKLARVLEQQPFDVIHFRSIFEGAVVVDPELNRGAKLIYEANGFPSIEMKYHHPELIGEPALLQKMEAQENRCLHSVDHIITVSQTSRDYIGQRLKNAVPISVIPNGFDPSEFTGRKALPCEPNSPIRIAYFGTATHWQGVEVLLQAIELLSKERDCMLTIAGPASSRQQQSLQRTIERLKISKLVRRFVATSKSQICSLLHQSHMTVVPLLDLDRNSVQGCCPIKLIEAMASGCPVIATNLSVVQELATPEVDYLPAKSGDSRNLKNLMLQLANDYDLALTLSQNARKKATENWTWDIACQKLLSVYQSVLSR